MIIRSTRALLDIGVQLIRYSGFVARNFWAFYLVIGLTAAGLALEYAATSLMIPIAPGASQTGSGIVAFWHDMAGLLGLDPSTRLWLWLFFMLMTVRLVFGYMLAVLTSWLGKQVHKSLSGKVFGHILMHEPMTRVYTRSVGHYITMAGDDTFKSGTIVSSLLQAMSGFLTAAVALVVLYQFSSILFVGVVLFLVFSAILIAALLRRVLRVNFQAVDLSRELGTTFVEALNSLRSIRSLHSELFVMRTYADQIARYIRMLVELDAIKTGVKSLPAVILLVLASVALRPGTEVGLADSALFGGTIIIVRVFAALGQMMTAGSQLLTDIRAVKDIGALVSIGSEEFQPATAARPDRIRDISIENISFAYAGRGRVLDDLSFRFVSGRCYAIIGPSGSGKSTLADLLLGLNDVEGGRLLINGIDMHSDGGRRSIMLVEQQPKIFSTTVRGNLLMGAAGDDALLHAALDAVNLDDMVRGLPSGLDTPLTYLGENFSGGQRQRLGIARALVRQPDVLILDEATSALDPETRQAVVAKLRQRMSAGIIIFITHDAEIASLADEVLPIGQIQPAMATALVGK